MYTFIGDQSTHKYQFAIPPEPGELPESTAIVRIRDNAASSTNVLSDGPAACDIKRKAGKYWSQQTSYTEAGIPGLINCQPRAAEQQQGQGYFQTQVIMDEHIAFTHKPNQLPARRSSADLKRIVGSRRSSRPGNYRDIVASRRKLPREYVRHRLDPAYAGAKRT
jgi:hypothetical protein